MKSKNLLLSLILLLLVGSCSKNRFKIDTNEVPLKLEIERFDRDLMALDTAIIDQGVRKLHDKYGEFFQRFSGSVIMLGQPESDDFLLHLTGFLADSMVQEIYKESQLVFDDVSGIETEITDAFKYIKHYFPKKKIPRVAMHISGFNQSIVVTNELISVSVDNYLGADYAPYKSIAYSYQLQHMTPNKVAPDVLLGYLMTEFPYENNTQLLAGILSRAKVLYLQSVCMPQRNEADLMGYTPEQLNWCVENEKNMWTVLVENKHLYSTSQLVASKYLNTAPFTSFFTENSPGQASIWLGLQIVKSYMQSNRAVTLPELMEQQDYQLILEESNYKPS